MSALEVFLDSVEQVGLTEGKDRKEFAEWVLGTMFASAIIDTFA